MTEAMAKRAAENHLSPHLEHPGILSEVLEFVGPGQFAFAGAVSKSFRDGALKVEPYETVDYNEAGEDTDVELSPHMSTHAAIFAAPSRLLWAINSGFFLKADDWRVQYWAGWHGDVETLSMLHDRYGMQWTESISRGAAESGSVSKLRWLLDEQHCPQAVDICDSAAVAYGTEALAWLKERGCAITASTCARAAVNVSADAIAALKYLRSVGCEWDERTANNAAQYGDLQTLQWLYKQGAPWSTATVCQAAEAGHADTVVWLLDKCPCEHTAVLSSAAGAGSIDVLQGLKECGAVEWTPAALAPALGAAIVSDKLDTCQVSYKLLQFIFLFAQPQSKSFKVSVCIM
jgi:phage gp46-like protein